ncbi:MAG: caspase family protein [Anaerolineae bacterium]
MPAMENAHALVVGIADYQSITRLPQTVLKDAQDIYDMLIDPQHCGYLRDNVQLLRNGEATQAALRQALADLAEHGHENAVVFIYISSHGGRIESGPYAGEYLLPVDTDYTSGASLARTAISGPDFTQALRASPARKAVVVFDCCHAAGIAQPKADVPPIQTGLPESYYESLLAGRGRAILASSRSSERSYILPGAKNSLFTQHLLAGLQGGIPSDDGLIRIFDLFEYLQPRVVADRPNQHPVFKAEIEENFAIGLYRGGKKGSTPKDEEGFRYDAFVSYIDAEPDATWVWDNMLPRLEQAGLRIAVSADVYQPGVARVVNIERGVTQAKRTVLVLSDGYLADQWAAFENTLGQTIGIEEGTYRLLPVKIAPLDESRVPLRLKALFPPIDLIHPRRAEREFRRLEQSLRMPLPRR